MILAIGMALSLIAYSVLANLRETRPVVYVVRNVVAAAVLVLVARGAGLGWSVLGLAVDDLPAGLRWGWLAVLVVAVGMAAVAAGAGRVEAVARLLADRRADLPPEELAFQAFVRIPIGTALFEEVAFRGVLLGAFLATTATATAVAASSVVFGLWHVVPTLRTLDINGVEDPDARWRGVAGAVVATTVAGAVLAGLRLVSGSVLAPVLAHAAVNSFGLLVAAFHHRTADRDGH